MKTKFVFVLAALLPLVLLANTIEPTSVLEFQQTTNTGMVVEDSYLRFFTGGTKRMIIDQDGNARDELSKKIKLFSKVIIDKKIERIEILMLYQITSRFM
ncbi:hypothetical protein [Reichenbachiella sp.]|uniref:hypothetical protein n=1 Tax=Reichenbachiella sp. TaxID=2184521 RepID=UPI003BAEEDD8